MFRIARWGLPVLALVGLVGTACTPVKPQLGRNISGYSITNGCLPGLGNAEPANIYASPSPNFSREVCSGGFGIHSITAQGVTLQVVNANGPFPTGSFGAAASFTLAGVHQLGDLAALKINVAPGSDSVIPSLILDKNGDGSFLCAPDGTGKTTGFCGDAVAQFANGTGRNEHVYENTEETFLFAAPCNNVVFPFFSCLKQTGTNIFVTLGELKQGAQAGVDGFTKALLVISLFGGDDKATVTGVEINGTQYLP